MRYALVVWVLAVAVAVSIGCQQNETGPQPQQSQVGRDSQGNTDSPNGRELQAADGPNPGSEAQAADESQAGPHRQAGQGGSTDEEPLLLLDDEPLLLDDEPLLLDDGEQEPSGPVADNSRCHHCHLNYVDEELAVVHARANIGCADCHGNCDEHIADESWASGGNGTPPEIMYPQEKINPFCLGCHPKDKIGTLEHQPFFAGTAKEKLCTDCHGDHRLTERRCKWR